jgi:hypothetical protein
LRLELDDLLGAHTKNVPTHDLGTGRETEFTRPAHSSLETCDQRSVHRGEKRCWNTQVSRPRWEHLVEPTEVVPLLWKAQRDLRFAWRFDQTLAPDYPFNVSYALQETMDDLFEQFHIGRKKFRYPPTLIAPNNLNELVPDSLVASKWEEQHCGTYRRALKQAAEAGPRNRRQSLKAFQAILRALEAAYMVRYWGIEQLQKPRVNIVHRGLNQIAKDVGLRGLTAKGFAEFLDDLCPCGLRDHAGAVRKLWARSPNSRLSRR